MRTSPIRNHPSLILLILLPLILAAVLAIAPQPIALLQALSAAREAEAANRPADAAAELRLALSFQPWRIDLRERLGRNELAAGNIDAATAVFESIAAGRGLSTEGALALGESYRLAGDPQSALDTWERLIQSENAPVEAYQRICEVQRAAANVDQAISACRVWVRAHPDDPQAVYLLGLLLAAQAPSEAVGYLEQAGEMDPALKPRLSELVEAAKWLAEDHRDAIGWLELGRALASRKDWDLAALAFMEAARLEPGYSEAWAFWGEARNQTGQDGLEQLERALSLNPGSALGHVFLALHWRRQGDLDQALRHIRAAVRSEPKQAAWQIELGIILTESGDLRAALTRFRTAAELEPANPFYWRLLTRFCILNAIEVRGVGLPAARTALMLTPLDPEALDLAGWTLMTLEDYTTATRFLRAALVREGEYAPAHLHLGQLYLQTGNPQSAYFHLRRAAENANEDAVTALLADRLLAQYFGSSDE